MRARDAEDERKVDGRDFGAAWRECFGIKGSGFDDPSNCDIAMEGNGRGRGLATGHGSTTVDMSVRRCWKSGGKGEGVCHY
jgi:hypothetical protein